MNDEQIKNIIVSLIENKLVYCGSTNEETGKEIANLYISMKKALNEYYNE